MNDQPGEQDDPDGPDELDEPGEQPAPSAVDAAVAALKLQFPGVSVWYGRSTGRWWALLPIGKEGHLVEASTPEHLAQAIAAAQSWRGR